MAIAIRQLLGRTVSRNTHGLPKLLQNPQTISSFNVYQTSTGFFHTANKRLSSIINIQDEEDFKNRVIKSSIPVVVDFHADWCGPCKLLGPRLETLIGSKNTEEQKVVLAKVDIDEIPDIAMEYGVEAIPTVISVKNGKIMDKFVGLKEDTDIETFLVKLVG